MSFTLLQRGLLLLIAVASLAAAIGLIIWEGLPQRADYIGYQADGLGYVAPAIGQQAPPIDADTLTGNHLHLIDLRGQSVIINFWATWCAPCIHEMPELQAFYEASGVPVLGINIAEPRDVIRAWVQDLQITFEIVLDPAQLIYRQYRILGQPTTYIIDPDGIITHIFYGPTTADALQRAIDTHRA